MKLANVALVAVAAATLLAGCSSTPAAPPKDGGTYSSLNDLKDAYVKAGGDCTNFTKINNKDAAESGRCGEGKFILTYVNNSQVSAAVQQAKDVFSHDSTGQNPWLVGQNWIVEGPDASQLQAKLGGQLVTFPGS